jgi:hypothetical protein
MQCWCHYTETAKENGASLVNYTESTNFVFAKCSEQNSDLNTVMYEHYRHLNSSDQIKLPKLLTAFEDLFDGTLCDWDTEPVSLKLKESGKPYHDRPSPMVERL